MPNFGSCQPWKIGCRYEVVHDCDLFAHPLPDSEAVWNLKPQDQVLLLALSQDRTSAGAMGFVQPSVTHSHAYPGWISLDGGDIFPNPLENSWEMKARYSVIHPCTIRAEKSLNSPILCEMQGGEEVLVLELGIATDVVNPDASSTHIIPTQPRLRACVAVMDGDTIGWLSPEPMANIRLLEPVNLLGPKVVELHRKIAQSNASSLPDSRKNTRVAAWREGCQYRILQSQQLRSEARLLSNRLTDLPAGTIVEVLATSIVQCPVAGACPCVFVYVREGPSAGWEGWLRCIAMEGHDVIDTRDQLAFDKIMTGKIPAPSRSINGDSVTASEASKRKDEPVAWLLGDSRVFGERDERIPEGIPEEECPCYMDFLSNDDEDTFPFQASDDTRHFSGGTIEEDAQCFSWDCGRRSDRSIWRRSI